MIGQFSVFCLLSVAQLDSETVSRAELTNLLAGESELFRNRPKMEFNISSNLEVLEGSEGPQAYKKVSRLGTIRWGGDRFESTHSDSSWNESTQTYEVTHERRRVWKDERTFGTEKYLSGGNWKSRAFTTRTVLHEYARPDMDGWFLDGVFVDSIHYSDMLLQAQDLEGIREQWDGQEYVRISGTSEQGKLSVWLSNSPPHTLRRAEFEASPSYSRDHGANGMELEVEVTGFDETHGMTFPTQGVATYKYDMSDDSIPIKKRVEADRFDLIIDPEFSDIEDFTIEIAEGMMVTDYDTLTRFTWRDGKLALYVEPYIEGLISGLLDDVESEISEDTIETLDDGASTDISNAATQKGTEREQIPRLVVVLCVGLLVATLLATLAWWSRRKRI